MKKEQVAKEVAEAAAAVAKVGGVTTEVKPGETPKEGEASKTTATTAKASATAPEASKKKEKRSKKK